MRYKLALAIGFLGAFIVMLAQIISIGYGLYLWANVLPFSQALWAAFQLWIEMTVLGFVLYVSHIFIKS